MPSDNWSGRYLCIFLTVQCFARSATNPSPRPKGVTGEAGAALYPTSSKPGFKGHQGPLSPSPWQLVQTRQSSAVAARLLRAQAGKGQRPASGSLGRSGSGLERPAGQSRTSLGTPRYVA
ncbi:unnamed protein product [Lepidochelys kempii]